MELITTTKATDIYFDMPGSCGFCGHSSKWFRNEGGRTRCIYCVDQQPEKEKRYG